MGILDSLPQGLLDLIHNSALNQNLNAGLGADTAGYQPAGYQPPLGFAPQQQPQQPERIFRPNELNPIDQAMGGAPATDLSAASRSAPLPMSPPPVVQASPQTAPQSPSLGDRLATGFRGMGANMAGGPIGMLMGGIAGVAGLNNPNNATAQALLAKGVDPTVVKAASENPEVMKQLVTQTFGPQTVTSLGNGYVADRNGKVTQAYQPDKAPTALGQGYIYNPTTKKVEQAYQPEDKIPAGFAKGDDGNMHFIPGGPADPAYIQLAEVKKKDPSGNYVLGRGGEIVKNNADGTVTVMHKNEPEAPVPMDPNALEILARREIGGDFSGRKNLGRGAQGAADLKAITNKSAEILTSEMGMSPTDAAAHLLKKQQEYAAQGQGLNSEARTTGVREANLNLILKAADAAIPAALEASDKVARTGWVPLNKIIQGGQVMASDPDLKKFGMANLQLAEHWARAMNPTGVMRGEDRDIALSYLGTMDSKETYKQAVGQLRTQIERERDAVRSSRGMSDLPGASSSATPAPGAAPKPGSYVWTPGSGLVGGK